MGADSSSCFLNLSLMEFVSSVSTDGIRQSLNLMSIQRDALEAEADAIHSELTSPGINGEPPAGVKTPLIDSEGYPRADIDVINVKNKRRRLAEINTDYKELMKKIESTMLQLHQSMPDVPQAIATTTTPAPVTTSSTSVLSPIAKLDEVLPGSPAATAGIQENDLLVKFGTITSTTESCLSSIAQLVGRSANQPIAIVVQRASTSGGSAADTSGASVKVENVELTITPQPWGGRGLLGCHLTPIQQ